MLTPREIEEMQFTSLTDQWLGYLHDHALEIQYINERHPSTWSESDHQMIQGAVCGLLGMVYAGKL